MRAIAILSFILATASLNGPAFGMFGYGRALLQAALFVAVGIAAHLAAEKADRKRRFKHKRRKMLKTKI